MTDIIQGPVTNVIDGDTFDMNVTQIGTIGVRSLSWIDIEGK